MIKNKHLKNLTINKSLLKNHIENLIKEKKNIIKPNIDHSDNNKYLQTSESTQYTQSTQSIQLNNILSKSNTNNLGFYIPYTLINSDQTYEYLDELSFIIKNTNRTDGSLNNMFRWKNTLDNNIKNLMFIYIHIMTIPLYPWLNKILYTGLDLMLIDFILNLKDNLKPNQEINYLLQTIQIQYVDFEIIDFVINNNYTQTYSIEILSSNVYLYTRSNKMITDTGFLYVDIDSNDNLNNNIVLTTGVQNKKFSFKITPIIISNQFAFYNSIGQYLIHSLNELQNLYFLTVNIYDQTYKPLTNTYINKSLYNSNNDCNCVCEGIQYPACYCNYIRHPSNPSNQIDIGFKIGQIKNELINNIFH